MTIIAVLTAVLLGLIFAVKEKEPQQQETEIHAEVVKNPETISQTEQTTETEETENEYAIFDCMSEDQGAEDVEDFVFY